LAGADFSQVDLSADPGDAGAGPPDLRGAHYDARTRWPAGFDPKRHGAVRVP
jgi:hypothetical protein